MVLIDFLSARQILNSRGEPTIEVELKLTNGKSVITSVPSGKSVGAHEALELVDKDFAHYFGRGVSHAVDNINDKIAPRLKKIDPTAQEKVDKILLELDGTPNMIHMGSNAILAVSTAVCKAGAIAAEVRLYEHIHGLLIKLDTQDRHGERFELIGGQMEMNLPIPAFNLINGGAHGGGNIPIQEYLVFPVGVEKMAEKVRAVVEVRFALEKLLIKAGKSVNVGDEGGYAPKFDNPIEPLELLVEAVHKTNYYVDNKILYGFDVAGATLPDDFFSQVLPKYPILSVEDPYSEEDWENFVLINREYPDVFTVGDDLLATHTDRLYTAIEKGAVDCAIVKPNQVGTITKTLEFAKVAKHDNIALFASHRSGDTNDTFIVDLAIGIGAKFIKCGAPVRGERVAKYNYLMQIASRFEG